jgi:hypothetical protein
VKLSHNPPIIISLKTSSVGAIILPLGSDHDLFATKSLPKLKGVNETLFN